MEVYEYDTIHCEDLSFCHDQISKMLDILTVLVTSYQMLRLINIGSELNQGIKQILLNYSYHFKFWQKTAIEPRGTFQLFRPKEPSSFICKP